MLQLLLIALAQAPCGPAGPITCSSLTPQGALFEFAPASGAGMGTACGCTAITARSGATLSMARASNATCLKGKELTGIADGDMVTCGNNLPIISPRPDLGTGVLGWWYEFGATNLCIRASELCNAAWGNIGPSPGCASDQAPGPFGTTTMDLLTDDDGSSSEGRSQSITTTSATIHAISCFVKAGTSTSARVILQGTGSSTGDCTGTNTSLSTTTSTRITCTSPAPYGGGLTSVLVLVVVGANGTDQGTIYVEGCQHEVAALAGPTSFIDTAGAPVARAEGLLSVTQAVLTTAGVTEADGCIGGDVYQPDIKTDTAGLGCGIAGSDSNSRTPFVLTTIPREVRAFDGTNQNSSSGLAVGARFDALLPLAMRWKTGVGINSWSPSIGNGTINATYNDNAFGTGAFQFGRTGGGCGANDRFWLTRVRMDTYAKGCH